MMAIEKFQDGISLIKTLLYEHPEGLNINTISQIWVYTVIPLLNTWIDSRVRARSPSNITVLQKSIPFQINYKLLPY